jgi:hypothetical protein
MEYILIGYRSTHRRVIINNIYKSKMNFLCNTTIALAWEEPLHYLLKESAIFFETQTYGRGYSWD